MKYGKKREIKEILKKLENKKPFLKRNTKDKQEVNKEWSDYFPYIFIHSMGTLVGFFFLLWFSTLYIWFLALLFTVLTGFIHAYVDKKTQVSKDVLVENNPFTIFALCFAAVIYFSAPITDNGAYCAKVYEKSYEREVFGGINQDGSYNQVIGSTIGSNNNLTITQYGDNNSLDYWQDASDSTLEINQTASNSYLNVHQSGLSNNLVVNQTVSGNMHVMQVGVGNSATVNMN